MLRVQERLRWLAIASKNEDNETRGSIAEIYLNGEVVAKDIHQAIHILKQAVDCNYLPAIEMLIGAYKTIGFHDSEVDTLESMQKNKDKYGSTSIQHNKTWRILWTLDTAELGDFELQITAFRAFFFGNSIWNVHPDKPRAVHFMKLAQLTENNEQILKSILQQEENVDNIEKFIKWFYEDFNKMEKPYSDVTLKETIRISKMRIDVLENSLAQAEKLKNREISLRKKAEVQIAKLTCMTAQSTSNAIAESKPSLQLPTAAPERYSKREPGVPVRQKESALAFLKRVWGKYLDAGLLYQYHLRSNKIDSGLNMDPELMSGIRTHCRRHGGKPEDFVPREQEKGDIDLKNSSVTYEQAKRIVNIVEGRMRAKR